MTEVMRAVAVEELPKPEELLTEEQAEETVGGYLRFQPELVTRYGAVLEPVRRPPEEEQATPIPIPHPCEATPIPLP